MKQIPTGLSLQKITLLVLLGIIVVSINTKAQSYSLNVSKGGSGGGNVSSTPAGINCGSTCSFLFPSETFVTITATPDATSSFTGWSGAASGTNSSQSILMDGNKNVSANFTRNSYTLNIVKTGSGSGSVSSSPAGIDCGTTCTASYTAGSSVTLSATPASGSVFTGWSGGGCSGTGTCVVSMMSANTVTAQFEYTSNNYYSDNDGDGYGAGDVIIAGTQPPNTSINNLDCDDTNASVSPGATEICGNGTDEDCSGILDDCSKFTLNLSKSGSGGGVVSSSPAGINCGSTCSFLFASETFVTITATPDATSSFAGWSGAASGTSSSQSILMNGNKNVSANFTKNSYTLNVLKTGSGSGSVSSSPAGIDCGTTCSASYNAGSSVTLSATPASGSVFTGWSGGGCSGTGTCVVSIMSANTVVADFCLLPGVPEIISGNIQVCSETIQNYSIESVPNASGYSWTLPIGWIGSSTANSINATAGNSGVISVNASNSCGTGPSRTMNVTVENSPQDLVIKNGMVANYPLDNNANDKSGNGNNGLVSNSSLTTDRFGNPNKAYSFNGSSSYIDLGDKDLLNPHKNSITITAWAKKNVLNQHSRILSKGTHGGSQPGYDLMFYGSSGPTKAAVILSAGGHEHIVYSNNPINDLNWHFYAGVINRQGFINLYVDGVKQNDSINISNHQADDIGANTYKALIGASYSNFGNPGPISEYFNGVIDDVRIYMRALSKAEVSGIFHPLAVSVSTDSICENASADISLYNSQNGISYQLQNNGSLVGSPQTGDGSTLIFNSGSLTSTALFTIIAANNNLSCSISLDTLLRVTVNPVYTFNENQAICNGETFTWQGNDYSESGTYTAEYITIYGCDSSYTLNLTVHPAYQFSENHSICDGETYTWHGTDYNDSGTYIAEYTTINGCDSIYTLTLTVDPAYNFIENHSICDGETYSWHGNNYNDPGTYNAEYTTINGCDSVYTLTLTVHPAYQFSENHSICDGETYTWHGNNYNDPGTYNAAYTTINGCDSIYTLTLTVHPTYNFSENHSICDGETYTWHGNNYNDPGTYNAEYTTINGCDSVYTLTLTVHPAYNFSENHSICDGETYTWHGNDYTDSGTYISEYSTINGCDSIYILNLTITTLDVSVTVNESMISANMSGAEYQWIDCGNSYSGIIGETSQNFTAPSNGNYAVEIKKGSCSDTSLCIQITTVDNTSIPSEYISIFPNPVSNKLFIEINRRKDLTSFEILNNVGQIVFKGSLFERTCVETSSFDPGIYLIKIKYNQTTEIRKIIIE